MNNTKITILFCLFFATTSFRHPYERQVNAAMQTLREQQHTIQHIARQQPTDECEVLAIVFPEMIRWSAFNDFIETAAVEQLYVRQGKTVADFSIRHFQMKPSFIEDLEQYISEHPYLRTDKSVVIVERDVRKARALRISRLKTFDWQLRYAHTFWIVAKDKYKRYIFRNSAERVRFFASAYNYGFTRPDKDIFAWQRKRFFPYGRKNDDKQVAYAAMAVAFLEKW